MDASYNAPSDSPLPIGVKLIAVILALVAARGVYGALTGDGVAWLFLYVLEALIAWGLVRGARAAYFVFLLMSGIGGAGGIAFLTIAAVYAPVSELLFSRDGGLIAGLTAVWLFFAYMRRPSVRRAFSAQRAT